MVVKVDNRNLKRRFKALNDRINSTRDRKEVGFFIISTIRDRTRKKGKGVARAGGRVRTLKPVTKQYAKWRKKQKRHPQAASGRKSNLTFSGKMLNDLIVKRATKTQLLIGFRTQLSEDKAEWQSDQGRPFMFLSRGEIQKTTEFIKDKILGKS